MRLDEAGCEGRLTQVFDIDSVDNRLITELSWLTEGRGVYRGGGLQIISCFDQS